MSLVAILARIGDENIHVQSLISDITAGNIGRKGATITFSTDPKFVSDINRAAACSPAKKVGLVVWVDSEKWDAAKNPAVECHGLDTPERVCFYEPDFYVLSNFSAFQMWWRDLLFDTSEQAYHWEKFPGAPDVQWEIVHAESAHDAFKVAERNRARRRADWDDVKVGIMRDILRAKAQQHEYVRRKLLATGERELVENSWRDDFWGWGPNRDGKNTLGKLWMEVRAELRAGGAS